MGSLALVVVIFGLGRIAILNSERRDAEKKRGDLLQKSVDSLRTNGEENRKFFEIIREYVTAQNAEERQALLDELRGFKFTPSTTTTTVKPKKSTPTTTATTAPPKTSTTTAPRPPPTTTSTTVPPSPPPSRPCVSVPLVVNVCPQPPTASERNHS